jgi:hypothetical protein
MVSGWSSVQSCAYVQLLQDKGRDANINIKEQW